MRTDRIVIGVDFSPPSIAAARWTMQEFARGAEFVLVHALDVPTAPPFLRGRFPDADTLLADARIGAEARFAELRPAFGAAKVSCEVRVGHAAEEIVAAAREHGAQLVVVAKHGERHGVWRQPGSTAEQVVRSATLPVLMVAEPRWGRPRRILAAIDDSMIARTVLAWASALARRWDADVTALHVVSSAVMSHVLSMASIGAEEDVEPTPEFVREEFGAERDRWVEKLAEAGVAPAHASSEIAFGEAGQEIVAAMHRLDADLIVLGDQGAGAVPRFLFGRTLREVLRSATRPVLVVGTTSGG